MINSKEEGERKLRILHVLRAPLGGLFRHVLDLSREQIARGHAVGLVTDSTTGGLRGETELASLAPSLELGLYRLPMRRQPHLSDVLAQAKIALHSRKLAPDIVHGHGSKGGLYARLPAFLPGFGTPIRAYTPHGGSFNYTGSKMSKKVYMAVERMLERVTDLFLFESAFIGRSFHAQVGATQALVRVVPNGISPAEFEPVLPNANAADFFYVGELRSAKGIDIAIDALAELRKRLSRCPSLVLIGAGPDQNKLTAHAAERGVADRVSFMGPMPARTAFSLGRVLVVPSRAESLPYIVLEAAGAQVPMVATNVGGIGEIFGPYQDRLVICNDAQVLASAMATMLDMPVEQRQSEAAALAAFVATRFTITGMADSVLAGYREAFDHRGAYGRARAPSFVLPSQSR